MLQNEEPLFTWKQMCEMISITRSWTLNNPSGPLPPLPMCWVKGIPYEQQIEALYRHMPEYKENHPIIDALINGKIF